MRSFLAHESAGGIILIMVAFLALMIANSSIAPFYFQTLNAHIGNLSLLHWINDGLMTIFFLLVGLEIKREVLKGQLSKWQQRALPGLAALGGMVVPALIYLIINNHADGNSDGWAIPAATDIAFALGILSLLGSRVPASLKLFLTALAIIDDLGAVLIISLFFTASINLLPFVGAVVTIGGLIWLNRRGITRLGPYLALGILLWILMAQTGIHATIAGVILAMAIPLRSSHSSKSNVSPLLRLEHTLQPWVAFFIIPVFGFANAGISLSGISLSSLAEPVPLGVALGLFLGKQLGVFSFAWLAIRFRLAKLPQGATWMQLYGVSLICGIGFTMSLFIGLLAFANQPALQEATKLGVILGSVISAVAGALILIAFAKNKQSRLVNP